MNIMEYPRPQLQRESFMSLDGKWKLNGFDINVPYPPQAALAHYQGELNSKLLYQKEFSLPDNFYHCNQKILLHFGAVDQTAKIYLNDKYIGSHEGGYLPFYFDLSTAITNGKNKLVVEVIDNLSNDYPYGKQAPKSHGMWYTQVSGIWQSVWLEAVDNNYIKNIKITPSLTSVKLQIETNAKAFTVEIKDINFKQTFTNKEIEITISNPHLWYPDDPYLYSFSITTDDDKIDSYFALRTVTINNQKILLNNRPIFLHGLLDQGYYYDGLFLPSDRNFYETEILKIKKLGFNLLRKHIKIEPELFYYACDRLGILVMQDMVNNGKYNFIKDTLIPTLGFQKRNDKINLLTRRHHIFKQHMIDTLIHLYNHPSIISYTIFNEGWGQFNSDQMYELCKSLDATRFYDSTSGWFFQKKSDVVSKHIYFRNTILSTKFNQPILLSECGGYTRAIDEHTSNQKKQYGYGKASSEKELTDKIEQMYYKMVMPSIEHGLCGCIYTQVSDIENEINGIFTYDRSVCKVNQKRMQDLARQLYTYYQNKSG